MGIIIRYGVIVGNEKEIDSFEQRKREIEEMAAAKTYAVLDSVDMVFVSHQQAIDYIDRVSSDDVITAIFRFSLRG